MKTRVRNAHKRYISICYFIAVKELVAVLCVPPRIMKILIKVLLVLFVCFSQPVFAENMDVVTVKSPENRVALLELYTSEGCSSCPPAERWLSNLKKSGVSSQQLIPLTFHVTYWDYIGWRDRFGSERYDQRQRNIAKYNTQRTIYTPQFVLAGSDYRTHRQFTNDVGEIVSQKSVVDLKLSVQKVDASNISVELYADIAKSDVEDVALFLTVYEDDLSSDVDDGENKGEVLHHDYVVRQIYGPFIQSTPDAKSSIRPSIKHVVEIDKSWKNKDLSLVAFAQNPHTGEVLQAVRLALAE